MTTASSGKIARETLLDGATNLHVAGLARETLLAPVLVAGAGRYWRINILATVGDIGPGLAEIAFHASIGGANIISGGTASAQFVSATFVASNAADGNPATLWTTGAGAPSPDLPCWWQYDFGAGNTVSVVEVALTSRNDSFWEEAPQAFTLDYSSDGITWTTLFQVNGTGFSAAGQTNTFNTAATTTHSFNAHDLFNIALSNSNLTATATTTGWKSVRTTPPLTAGKWYVEIHADTIVGNVWTLVFGYMNSSAPVNNFVGSSANSFGLQSGGSGYLGSGGAGTPPSFSQGTTVGMAVDVVNRLCWFAANNVWTGNPTAGTGGCNLAGLGAGILFVAVSINDNTAAATMATTTTAQQFSAPSGFQALDGSGVSTPTVAPLGPWSGRLANLTAPEPDHTPYQRMRRWRQALSNLFPPPSPVVPRPGPAKPRLVEPEAFDPTPQQWAARRRRLTPLYPRPSGRASQLAVEIVALNTAPGARASQLMVEVLGAISPPARASQLVVETLGFIAPPARVSQLVVEVLAIPTPVISVLGVQVAGTAAGLVLADIGLAPGGAVAHGAFGRLVVTVPVFGLGGTAMAGRSGPVEAVVTHIQCPASYRGLPLTGAEIFVGDPVNLRRFVPDNEDDRTLYTLIYTDGFAPDGYCLQCRYGANQLTTLVIQIPTEVVHCRIQHFPFNIFDEQN